MRSIRFIKVIAVTVLMVLGFTVTALAENNYRIYGAGWTENEGRLIAEWEKAESSTPYKVQLYKNGSACGKEVTTSSSKYAFTNTIITKGAGNYYFSVYPVKGGTSMLINSDVIEVDSYMLKAARAAVETDKSALPHAVKNGWIYSPGGTWSYYRNDVAVKDAWLQDAGKWYLMDKNGNMLTGWQFYKSRWYCLEAKGTSSMPKGACYMNCVTPDGFQVNEKGEWVDNGKVVTTKNYTKPSEKGGTKIVIPSATSPAGREVAPKTIKSCAISLKVDAPTTLSPSYAEPTNATYSTIAGYTFSIPYTEWKAGQSVTITVVVTPKSGYAFNNSTKFTCSAATVESYSRSGESRTVVLRYMPTKQLTTPTGFYTDSAYSQTLYWDKTPQATKYKVIIFNGNRQLKSLTVTTTEVDLFEYCDNEDYTNGINVKVSALADNKNIKESPQAVINDFEHWRETNFIDGTFEREGKKVTYTESGWQKIGGYWYYFNDSGTAKSGWYKDTDGTWYYLDPDTKRMVTGYVTVSGTTYFLNDGSVAGAPLGAWIEGR